MTTVSTSRRTGVNSGKAIKVPAACATTANITLSGEQSIDGVTTSSSRVLVKSQTDQTANGLYDSSTGDWTRCIDFDGNDDFSQGTIVMVIGGTANANTYWRVSTVDPITLGTSNITFAPAVAGDSAAVAFVRSETGAVTRTLQAKAREVMTLADFDGSTNYEAAQLAKGYNHFAVTPNGSCGNLTLTGTQNTGLGYTALASATSGSFNTGVGSQALYTLTTGTYNCAFGLAALNRVTSGARNVGIGVSAGFNITSGTDNVGVGYSALNLITTATGNTAAGENAAVNLVSGIDNVAVGIEALTGNVVRDWCTYNTFVAGLANWRFGGVALGSQAVWSDGGGKASKSADGTTAMTRVGDDAPVDVMVGLDFTVTYTILDWTAGSVTVSVGGISDAARSANGTYTFSGTTTTTAGLAFTPTNTSRFSVNTVTMFMTTTQSGSHNVAVGSQAMWYQVTGSYNVAVGKFALHLNAVGSRNIALGNYAGYYEAGSDKFYVNNQDRTSAANDIAQSLMYGVMAAAPANQSLQVNVGTFTCGAITNKFGGTGSNNQVKLDLYNASTLKWSINERGDSSDVLQINSATVNAAQITQAGAWTLTQHVAGTPTWVAGDCYLVVNASGNVHVSAVGPAS